LRWKSSPILPILTLIALAVPGCGSPAKDWPYAVTIGGVRMNVEVAVRDAERRRGLMERDFLRDDWGMLFVWPREQPLQFWMKDTRIPLSIAFLDNALVVRDVQDMKPQTLDAHDSSVPARYALEVNEGWFAKHKIAPGAKASFSPGLVEYLRTHPVE